MDQNQRLLLERNASALAGVVKYDQISELLKLAKILSPEQIAQIEVSYEPSATADGE